MSTNSSSPTVSLYPPLLTICDHLHSCFNTTTGAIMITTITVSSILLLLPLCIFVLYLGYQRWRQQYWGTMSHSDLLTHNMVTIELIKILGTTLTSFGVHTDHRVVSTLGIILWSVDLSGQLFFHFLTCMEHYLAVVHPITYMRLRTANGIRVRNISIGCIWMLCCALSGFGSVIDYRTVIILCFCLFTFALIIISVCSISVLHVLINSGTGEGGGDAQRVNKSKLRAFYTIIAILVVLVLRSGGSISTVALYETLQLGKSERCGVFLSLLWFSLPSSLVSPMLFLHRAGKLVCFKNSKGTRTRYD